jgi:hypothetical protein
MPPRFGVVTIGEGVFLQARGGVSPMLAGATLIAAAFAAMSFAAAGPWAETLLITADTLVFMCAFKLGLDRRLGGVVSRARRTISIAPRRRFDPAAPGVRGAAPIFEPVLDIDGESQPPPRGVIVRRSPPAQWTVYVRLAEGALVVDDFADEAGAMALAARLAGVLKLPPPASAPALSFRPGTPPVWAIVGLLVAHIATISALAPRLAHHAEEPLLTAGLTAAVLGVLGAVSWATIVGLGTGAERARVRRELG